MTRLALPGGVFVCKTRTSMCSMVEAVWWARVLQVVSDIVKGSVIEELCRLLFLVADEEADRQVKAANPGAEDGTPLVAPKAAVLQEAQVS